jgi:C4-dicarboxylate-specific signal transduction histidine kinase
MKLFFALGFPLEPATSAATIVSKLNSNATVLDNIGLNENDVHGDRAAIASAIDDFINATDGSIEVSGFASFEKANPFNKDPALATARAEMVKALIKSRPSAASRAVNIGGHSHTADKDDPDTDSDKRSRRKAASTRDRRCSFRSSSSLLSCAMRLEGRIHLWLQSEITERESAKEGLIRAQAEIARITRITTMGELAASIAHELNQPLGSIVTSGDACVRWLTAKPPNLDEVRQAVEAIIRDGTRASRVIVRIRGLLRRGERFRERSDVNEIIREVIALSEGELRRNGASLRTEMLGNLPPVVVDRVLLQQVILNLMMNAVEAMRAVSDRARVLRIRTEEQPSGSIVVLVQDSGVGLDPQDSSRMFEAFYTTKGQGIGMGLTISRSIIEAHGGRLWAVANDGPGSTFCFRLPIDKGS